MPALRAADEIVGTLFVSARCRGITGEEVPCLARWPQWPTAIHRIYLHEKAIRRLEQLQAARSIDQAISSSLDLQLTINVLLDHVVAQPKVAAAAIFLLNPHLKRLEYAAGKGFNTIAIQKKQLRLGDDTAIGRAALERRTIIVSESGAARSEDCSHLPGRERFSGCINFPLSPGEGNRSACRFCASRKPTASALVSWKSWPARRALPLIAPGFLKGCSVQTRS